MDTLPAHADVVIAGGGPAGLALAAPLAARGLDVLVVEQNARIGEPVRTSGASWPADLRALGLPDRLWHPVTRLSFRSARQSLVLDWGAPLGCAVDVGATWRHLAGLASAAGASVVTSASARWDGPGAVVVRHGGAQVRVSCRLAVDATGVWAALARAAGIHPGFPRVGVGYEEELRAPAFPQDEAVLVVGSAAPAGYGWALPSGAGRVRVGVGVNVPDVRANPRGLLPGVARALDAELAGSHLLERHSGRIPSGPAPRRLTADGLLVLGDSGAHSNPLVGEGIRHVIAAARVAAPIAARALDRPGLVRRERLLRWELRGRRVRGIGYGLALRANRYASRMGEDDWDRALERLQVVGTDAMTAILHGELAGPALAAAARGGPHAAWRLVRPFLRGGRAPRPAPQHWGAD